ncbi:MAG: zinc-ribbon domain-containing protein, partial [Burkholderiales bacterium]|nr:zinc-ribbon domain-containing protein [Burkholderiales bacterium]
MSLATRCPACGTAFRVVQDQLRVSGGWVRCGMCQQVFNGLDALIAEPVAPLPTERSASPPALPEAAAPEPPRSEIPTGEAWEADAGWSLFGPGVGAGVSEPTPADRPTAPSLPPPDFDPVLRGVTLPPGHGGGISTFGEITAATAQRGPVSQPPDALRVDPPPSGRRRRRKPRFMRQAERE